MRFNSLFLAAALGSTLAAAQTLPAVDGQALDGTAVHLPDHRQPLVIVVGFSRKAGDEVMVWGKTLTHEPWNTKLATVYEVALLGDVPRPFRGLVERSIRKQVSPVGQQHFLTVYSDAKPWKALAGVQSSDDAYLLVADAAGNVRWQGHGPYSPALDEEVMRQVGLLSRP